MGGSGHEPREPDPPGMFAICLPVLGLRIFKGVPADSECRESRWGMSKGLSTSDYLGKVDFLEIKIAHTNALRTALESRRQRHGEV